MLLYISPNKINFRPQNPNYQNEKNQNLIIDFIYFSGRVVNNDHFLFWGDVMKTNEEGTDFLIQVSTLVYL